MRRHLVQDPARRRDQPVAAFFLHARQTGEEFVGDVLAEAFLAERAGLRCPASRCAISFRSAVRLSNQSQLEARDRHVVDLAEVVVQARDFEPVAVRSRPCATTRGCRAPCPTAPPSCRPRSSRRCRRCRTRRPRSDRRRTRSPACSAASDTRCVTTPAPREDRRDGCGRRPAARAFRPRPAVSSFSVLMTADERRERNRAAGVAGAAAARDDGQAELDAGRDQAGHLVFGVRRQHHERILDAPVGRVGDVRDARQAVELDVVLLRDAAQQLARGALAQVARCRGTRPRTSSTALRAAASRCATLPSRSPSRRLRHVRRRGAACRSRSGGDAAPRSAPRGASGCRAGRPAGTDCAAPPRCRRAPRTACAPSGRCGARRATRRASPRRSAPSSRITISRSENDV